MRPVAIGSMVLALGLASCGAPASPPDAALPDAGRDAAPSCSSDDACEDGLACNGESRCVEGRCVAGAPIACDDGTACTTDFCSEELRACVNRPADEDGDGHAAASCLDERGTPLGDDCDDARPAVHPGAMELCDASGLDEDCDPSTFGGRDGDGDGFVDGACCNGAACGEDCNDASRGASPAGTEVCNGLDDDCDGRTDEMLLETVYRDVDGDGHGDPATSRMGCPGLSGYVALGDDCDDASALRSPSLFEACDGIDNDCDGTPDPTDVPDVVSWYEDADGDGFGVRAREVLSCSRPMGSYSLLPTDCDDTSRARHPAQPEQCNGIDDDCNGVADFELAPGDREDDDGDGRPDAACTPRPAQPDCDDRDASTGAGATEICDGRDNDCDAMVDEGVSATPFFRDADGDGWGSESGGVVVGCGSLLGYIERAGDCDDASRDRHPEHAESCNGADEDCDGRVDEDLGAESCTDIGDGPRACVAGRCREVASCPAGRGDCDGLAVNGCETRTDDDFLNCGACGVSCTGGREPGAVRACIAGACGHACDAGRGDCNGNLGGGGDGCETVLGTDSDCLGCGDACAGGERCNPVLRACEPAGGMCSYPTLDCDMNGSCESDVSANVSQCGACGRACMGMDAAWRCETGTCRVDGCTPPFLNCDGLDANGCERDGRTLTDCHACGRRCEGGNAMWTCGALDCEVVGCGPDFGNCDGVSANGCETSIRVDPLNCGTCGRRCQESHATSPCLGGVCGMLECDVGYLDCDGDLGMGGDGCETMAAMCPAVSWARPWGTAGDDTPLLSSFLTVFDVDTDSSGNAYVVAGFNGSTRFDGTMHSASSFGTLVFSLGPSGAVRWAHNLHGTMVDVIGLRLVVRGTRVYVAGSTGGVGDVLHDTTVVGAASTFVQPLAMALQTSDGTHVWTRIVGTTMGADARALDVSSSGAVVYVAGFMASDLSPGVVAPLGGSDDGYILRLSGSDGATLGADLVGGAGLQSIEALDFRASDGDYFLGGTYSGAGWSFGGRTFTAGGGNDGWVLRCSGSLSGCGAQVAIATTNDEGVTDVVAAPASFVFAGRYSGSTVVGGTAFAGTIDGGFVGGLSYFDGSFLWVRGHEGSMTMREGIRRVRADSTGGVRFVFGTTGGGSFGGTTVPTATTVQTYFGRISDVGVVTHVTPIPSTVAFEGMALAPLPDGSNVVAGVVSSSGDVGGVMVPSAGGVDPVVVRTRSF